MSDQSEDQTEAELERTRRVVAASMAEQVAATDATVSGDTQEAPKGNASRDEWAAYAAARGYEIDDEWTRDEIRDLFAEES